MILGIDPGSEGGVVLLDPFADVLFSYALSKISEKFLAGLFFDHRIQRAFLEKVHSSPQMGVRSAFTFGDAYGFLRGILVTAGIPFEHVRPQDWQKGMGCQGLERPERKRKLKQRAEQLFPKEPITLETADAYLIAYYGLTQWKLTGQHIPSTFLEGL